MDGSADLERWKRPKRMFLSPNNYQQKALNLDCYYSVEKHGQLIELRLDFPGGLSNDPADMQLMAEMHFDSLMRHGSQPMLLD